MNLSPASIGKRACDECHSTEEVVCCDWKVPREITLPIKEASVGDVWISETKKLRGRVVEIERVPHSDTNLVVWVKLPGHPEPYPYHRYIGAVYAPSSFVSERLLSCGAAVCFRHHREVGDNRHYCRDHWELQEVAV